MQLHYPVIGFTGRASAGKDTVANYVKKYYARHERIAMKIACADPLKKICTEVFGKAYGVNPISFYGTQAEKEAPLEALPNWTGRRILQYIGTEGFRHIDDEVWPRLMIAEARHMLSNDLADMILVADVRFLSEAEAIKKAGGIVVRVKRPEADAVSSAHASETQLAEIKEDYVIDNQGRELYLLEKLVEEFLCQLIF
jgi:hypothetical protein